MYIIIVIVSVTESSSDAITSSSDNSMSISLMVIDNTLLSLSSIEPSTVSSWYSDPKSCNNH